MLKNDTLVLLEPVGVSLLYQICNDHKRVRSIEDMKQ